MYICKQRLKGAKHFLFMAHSDGRPKAFGSLRAWFQGDFTLNLKSECQAVDEISHHCLIFFFVVLQSCTWSQILFLKSMWEVRLMSISNNVDWTCPYFLLVNLAVRFVFRLWLKGHILKIWETCFLAGWLYNAVVQIVLMLDEAEM